MFYGNKADNKKSYFGLNFQSNINCASSIYVILVIGRKRKLECVVDRSIENYINWCFYSLAHFVFRET